MTDQQALRRIAKNLRQFRDEQGLSMSEVARRIGGFPSAIQRIEDAESMPGVGLMTRIAEALGKSIEDFLEDARELARA